MNTSSKLQLLLEVTYPDFEVDLPKVDVGNYQGNKVYWTCTMVNKQKGHSIWVHGLSSMSNCVNLGLEIKESKVKTYNEKDHGFNAMFIDDYIHAKQNS